MAQKPLKEKYSVLREGTQFGTEVSVELTPGQAEAFLRAGDIGPFDPTRKPSKSKTAARNRRATAGADPAAEARIEELEAELASAIKANDAGAAALKAAEDGKAAAEAELATAQQGLTEYQEQVSALTIRVTEAEQLATEAASEAESLERVIAVIEETQPELVAQAKQTVAAEYGAAAETASQPQG